MTLTPEEKSWLAEVEERVNRALSTIQPEPFWNDFTRLLALVKRLVGENEMLRLSVRAEINTVNLFRVELREELKHLATAREDAAKWKSEYENLCKFATDYEGQRDTLRSQLEVAMEALRAIQHANGTPDDEDFITEEARSALAAIEGEGK